MRDIIVAIDDSIQRIDTGDSEISKLSKKYIDSLSPERKIDLFNRSVEALQQEPRFAEDILRTFLKRGTTTEVVTDKLAQMFSPAELGPVVLRIVESITSLQDGQSVPKQLLKLAIRLLLKAQQYYHLQEVVKQVAINKISTQPNFSMEERLKLCKEAMPLNHIVVDDRTRALTAELLELQKLLEVQIELLQRLQELAKSNPDAKKTYADAEFKLLDMVQMKECYDSFQMYDLTL